MNDMEEFFTRANANKGTKIDLQHPGGGETEHWLTILGTDSDEYHRANTKARRAMSLIEIEARLIEDLSEREEFLLAKQAEWETKIIAALLKGWSFEKEVTEENKVEFLVNAPQIKEQINVLSTKRQLFIKTGSKN